MPLHYNLSKVFFLSERKPEVVQAMVVTFISESTEALKFIKKGIHKKDYSKVFQYTASIESAIDLFGLDNAHDNAQRILNWTENKGKKKEIKETFKEFKKYIKSAVKELNKDYNLNQTVT
jgi:hypothetical protein